MQLSSISFYDNSNAYFNSNSTEQYGEAVSLVNAIITIVGASNITFSGVEGWRRGGKGVSRGFRKPPEQQFIVEEKDVQKEHEPS